MWRLKQRWQFATSVFRPAAQDRDLDEEIRSYANLLSDENVARGMSPQEARRAAQLAIGGVEQVKEQIRDRRPSASLSAFFQDLRYAARMLRKKPGFAAIAIGTLALGIGANTAVFSVINAALLTPIPVPSPDHVAMVWTENKARGLKNLPASVPDFRDWKASGIFQYLAAFNTDGLNLREGDRTERLQGFITTPDWFGVLGQKPIIGRTFTDAEAQPGHAGVVVLSWDFWNTHYQGKPSVLGSTLTINGTPHIIIGVLPKNTPRFDHEELYVPAVFEGPATQSRGTRSWLVVGRIKSGLSPTAAQQRLSDLYQRIVKRFPEEENGQSLRLQPVEDVFVQDVRVLLLVVFCAVGFVLLIACANIANLLLARGTARTKEMAIRAALGASGSRIVSQLLSESVLLAILGAIVGIVPAYAGIQLIPKLAGDLPNADLITLNAPVLLFAFGLALASALFFGWIPALQLRKAGVNQPLRESERGQTSARQNRLGGLFVVAEVAFTMILLAGAGLLLRSLLELRSHNPGYDARGALTMNIALTGPGFQDPNQRTTFLDTALTQLAAIPGIESAAASNAVPGDDTMHGTGLHFTDRPEPRPEDVPLVITASVSPHYFRTMGISLQQGRAFRVSDNAKTLPVAIVDETVADKYWPHENPIGKSIKLERKGPVLTVVGVVSPVEQNPLVKAILGDRGQVYTPLAQSPDASLSFVVRTRLADSAALIPEIRRTIANLNPDVPLYRIETLQELRAASHAPARMATILLTSFGAIALLLAAMGVFGVVSYTAGQRIREFGVRIALGATTSDLLKLTVSRGALLVAVGAVLGLVGAFALTRLLGNVLPDVSPNDPLTFAATTTILITVGLLASYFPARRASRVDPTIALRAE